MARSTKLSDSEKYAQQKELTRERQRRFREKMSEQKREEKKKYDRDRLDRLKREGIIKKISELTPREQREKRKYWRVQNKARSQRLKALAEVADTPPASPAGNGLEENIRKKLGRKQVRRDRAKAYRTIDKQKTKILNLERKLEKYKKRLQRQQNKLKDPSSPSPKKLVKQIVRGEKVSPNVKRELFLGFTIRKQLKAQAKEFSGSKKKNQILHKAVGNKVLKKYRVQTHFKDIMPYSANKHLDKNKPSTSLEYVRKPKKSVRKTLSNTLLRFFTDDRTSKMCPGKQDYVRRGPVKKQRRIFVDTMSNLYKSFISQYNVNISFASFCRSRPFWVTRPKLSDRETCACAKHSNMELLVSSLYNRKVISQRTYREVVNSMVCSVDIEDCMLSTCSTCKDNSINFNYDEGFSLSYFKWKNVKEMRIIKGTTKIVQKTIKSKEVKRIAKIESEFKTEMKVFKKQLYFIKHQSSEITEKIDTLLDNELLFRLDFSENYVTKYEKEVQSVHFGASKRQMSLNTGVFYSKVGDSVKKTCFATASDNLDHQAHAVWGHMEPIFKQASEIHPNTRTIHIFTDSPSNQYRNRINIHLFKTLIPKFFPNIKNMTWNYTEAGHGKGPMDGVGGTLKREADKKVLRGTDITCARDFVAALKDYKLLLLEIPSEAIQKYKLHKSALNKIPPITGIMKVHQITCSENTMYARTLSCFLCLPSEVCDHYHLSKVFASSSAQLGQDDQKKAPQQKLSVDEVYSTSDSEDEEVGPFQHDEPSTLPSVDILDLYDCNRDAAEFSNKTVPGAYVIVEYTIKKGKSQSGRQFLGICQGDITNEEVLVKFMKPCSKDNALYIFNESDISLVQQKQIVGLIPPPSIV